MTQGELFDAPVARPKAPKPLLCANGEPWMGPHPICDAQTEADCARFVEMVKAGVYNARGFTPAEWRAYLKRHPGESEHAGCVLV